MLLFFISIVVRNLLSGRFLVSYILPWIASRVFAKYFQNYVSLTSYSLHLVAILLEYYKAWYEFKSMRNPHPVLPFILFYMCSNANRNGSDHPTVRVPIHPWLCPLLWEVVIWVRARSRLFSNTCCTCFWQAVIWTPRTCPWRTLSGSTSSSL